MWSLAHSPAVGTFGDKWELRGFRTTRWAGPSCSRSRPTAPRTTAGPHGTRGHTVRARRRKFPRSQIPLPLDSLPRASRSYAGSDKAGSRWYIHARNIAASVLFVLAHGTHGEKYNVQGEIELDTPEATSSDPTLH